jgi:hypothetical protein
LAGLDFHQLDSVERFHPLTGFPLSQALLGAMKVLSTESDILLVAVQENPRIAS